MDFPNDRPGQRCKIVYFNNNNMDFSNYKFRCSNLGRLMTPSRSKKDILSKTTLAYLREIYIEEAYGRRKEVQTKFMVKGKEVEEVALDLYMEVCGGLPIKNKKLFENDFIKGTPDLLETDSVVDIKSSWDIWTFASSDGTNKDYYWQLQGYMELTKRMYAELAYCLVDTPDHLIVSEKTRRSYQLGMEDSTKEIAEMEAFVEKNMLFGDIPAKDRIKKFMFSYSNQGMEEVYNKVLAAREVLNEMSL